MFKILLISIVIVPILLGVQAAKGQVGQRGLWLLRTGWVLYSIFWLFLLYYLERQWGG